MPPLRRPRVELLHELGFSGKTDTEVIERAFKESPILVANCYSAASMWTANAATVSPSSDCDDQRLHLTPANLSSTLHRSLEGSSTAQILKAIFNGEKFCVHDPLSKAAALADEGAANHTRLVDQFDSSGIELFVYGVDTARSGSPKPKKFPARQTLLASQAVARRHRLNAAHTLFWQQNPAAIDAGVFHNDVIAVGHQNVLLCHELAFVDQAKRLTGLKQLFEGSFDSEFHIVELPCRDLPLEDAVKSYLFNSQLVTRPDGMMTLVCPVECEENPAAKKCTDWILESPAPIDEVRFLNLRQSMNNGGGPACLRLRVTMSGEEFESIHQGIVLTEDLASKLEAWIEANYRESIRPDDLRDPLLLKESVDAIESLAAIMELPIEVLMDRKQK